MALHGTVHANKRKTSAIKPIAEIMKKHILIVDDDASVRSSLEKILADSDYEVSVAEDGDSAEDDFAKADLLILDLYLPIQDGWDILGHVNSNYPLLPVIIITGLVDQLDETTIPGASAFLEKPIEVPVLLRTIERLLSQTPDERLVEAGRNSSTWQSPLIRSASADGRPKGASRVLKKFRPH
jgi:DNA-binding NtrC family response regulator